jgi:serine/threonine protein kinase
MSKACASTRLNANMWSLPLADGNVQTAHDWKDLDWEQAAAGAEAAQVEGIHDLTFSEMRLGHRLGAGSYGAAYACEFPSLSAGSLTVKLPKGMLDKAPALLAISADGGLWQKMGLRDQAEIERYEEAVEDFQDDFANFERIWDTQHLRARFAGGKLATGITREDHQQMLAEARTMEARAGRAHIHRIIHFDTSVPAIFSERCEGTLSELRYNAPDLFSAFHQLDGAWVMSEEWRRVGEQVGSAIVYMHSQGVAHRDIKVQNIFYRTNGDGSHHFLVSDFGLCNASDKLETDYYQCRTTLYNEPCMWAQRCLRPYNPVTLSVYTFAAVMCTCLRVPGIPFPVAYEGTAAAISYRYLDWEINDLRRRHPDLALFPTFTAFLPAFERLNPQWCHIVAILNWNYFSKRDKSNLHMLHAFLDSLKQGGV